jgi:hypothetical protein
MQDFMSSGRAIDVVLAVIALEAAILTVWWGRAKLVTIMATLAPGVCLLLAARAALTSADAMWIALWLAAAFPAHLFDVWCRRPQRRPDNA